MRHYNALLLAGLLVAAPASAQNSAPVAPGSSSASTTAPRSDNILDRAINQPGTNWTFYGPNKAKAVAAEGVPGGQAVQVTIAAKGANAFDVGAMSPIQKPIAAGDTILVAVYMRAPKLKAGETTSIPFFGANEGAAPYETIAANNAQVGPEWKLYRAAGKATKAFAAGKANGTVHLAAAKHVIELGPIFILDYGPDQDPGKLIN